VFSISKLGTNTIFFDYGIVNIAITGIYEYRTVSWVCTLVLVILAIIYAIVGMIIINKIKEKSEKMIHAFFLINNKGKARLIKIYNALFGNGKLVVDMINKEVLGYEKITKGNFFNIEMENGQKFRVIFRRYASLYAVCVIDNFESELAI